MKRKQFTFYSSFFEAIEKMRTKKEKADAYRILCDYALNGSEPDLSGESPYIAMIFGFSKPVLDTAHRRAERISKRTNVDSLLEALDNHGTN
jgi:hypothetical protein